MMLSEGARPEVVLRDADDTAELFFDAAELFCDETELFFDDTAMVRAEAVLPDGGSEEPSFILATPDLLK